jgi:hypothetical protein
MTYEIWSVPTGNIVATYHGEEDAWVALRRLAERHGPGYLDRLALSCEDDQGRTVTLAEGHDLTRHLRQHA